VNERGECGPQALGDLAEIEDGDVPLTAFDGADVGAVKAAPLGQFRLRPAKLEPPLADAEPYLGQKSGFVAVQQFRKTAANPSITVDPFSF
jgi:hypothetical protein